MQLTIEGKSEKPSISLRSEDLGFGKFFAPNMFRISYEDGCWKNPRIQKLQNLSLHPAAMVFHYGQEIFEGMKVYKHPDGSLYLFRPLDNFERMNRSAERMCMPTFDKALILQGLEELVRIDQAWVPSSPGTLYIRPTMIATQPYITVKPSNQYEFFVITSPSGGYFGDISQGPGTVNVYVCDKYTRAAPGGTGAAKTGGNYAGTLLAIKEAIEQECQQVLFLSAPDHSYVEELGGMNVFFLKDGKLITPELTGTILDGITRKSILQLASEFIEVSETRISIDSLMDEVKAGSVTEAIASGTGAGITAISCLKYQGEFVRVGDGKPGPVTRRLHELLTGIQFGLQEDPYGWLHKIAI